MGKSTFYWARIAGANFEPAEVTKEDGKRVARTIGCPDPFILDEPDCPCVLGEEMDRPLTPAQESYQTRKYFAQQKRLTTHSWRGPR